eukprot:3236973-Pyramimonas_sp.AAC.1
MLKAELAAEVLDKLAAEECAALLELAPAESVASWLQLMDRDAALASLQQVAGPEGGAVHMALPPPASAKFLGSVPAATAAAQVQYVESERLAELLQLMDHSAFNRMMQERSMHAAPAIPAAVQLMEAQVGSKSATHNTAGRCQCKA